MHILAIRAFAIKIAGDILEDFYEAGYDQGHLVEVVLAVGNIWTLNLL